ncbi:hypothetical protein SAMN04489731_12095 [Amycolatopsis regifaucium]|nr:hypothetical protein SAMN04489731_12095 [Amycolatopsis regifaucium]
MNCSSSSLAQSARGPATADLDTALFGPPYIYIAADNTAVAAVQQHPAHVSDVPPNAVTTVGTLHPAACGIDVDPGDNGAPAEAGHAFGDALVSWCERLGLPWLRRSSGRPGHLHLIALVPAQLRHELRTLCTQLARHHAISATVRSTLRLITAPHRLGLPCPIIDGTLNARDLPTPAQSRHRRAYRSRSRRFRARSPHTASRSESEYGDALARARAGWSTDQVWRAANRAGTAAADIGKQAWQRWIWAPARTIVDAEQHLPEETAWQQFIQASPVQARHLGRSRWLTERWLPAIDEARTHRPRRRTTRTQQRSQTASAMYDQGSQIAQTRRLLRITASLHLQRSPATQISIKPSTLYAALDALAAAIVTRSGSLSIRSWAERSFLDPKSVRRARDAAEQFGLIQRTHRYCGGPSDCDSWQLTKALNDLLSRLRGQSPTILYTPHTPSFGAANYERLKRTHLREQNQWRLLWVSRTDHNASTNGHTSPATTRHPFEHRHMPLGSNTPLKTAAIKIAGASLIDDRH